MKQILVICTLLLSSLAIAQDAVIEKPGLYGECIPQYTSKRNSLILYKDPNKNSKSKTIKYGQGWDIPYDGGVTRVISTGKLIAIKEFNLDWCRPPLKDGEGKIQTGDEVEYLYYTGEGYGDVLFNNSHCSAPIDEGYETFKTVSRPVVQIWLKVIFKDGSSPGWLLLDGSQAKVGDVLC